MLLPDTVPQGLFGDAAVHASYGAEIVWKRIDGICSKGRSNRPGSLHGLSASAVVAWYLSHWLHNMFEFELGERENKTHSTIGREDERIDEELKTRLNLLVWKWNIQKLPGSHFFSPLVWAFLKQLKQQQQPTSSLCKFTHTHTIKMPIGNNKNSMSTTCSTLPEKE